MPGHAPSAALRSPRREDEPSGALIPSVLDALVGRRHVMAPNDGQEAYVVDWRGRYHGRTVAVVKPADTAEDLATAERLVRVGARPIWASPADTVARERPMWREVIRTSGATADR